MTEEKPKEIPKENLKEPEVPKLLEETLKRIIREEIKQILPQPQNTAQTSRSISDTSEPQPEDAWQHIHTCPTCKPKLDKEKEEYAKEYAKKVAVESKDLQFECVGCGTHFEKGKKDCPNCHGTIVRSR